jgi:hypothetical protein
MASGLRGGRWRFAGAAVATACLVGCSSTDGAFSPTFLAPQSGPSGNAMQKQPTKDSEKLINLPATAADVNCPGVDVFEGGATSRVGGPANDAVRYQFNISDVARQCDPQGKDFALKIGVAGELLIGPAGSPGAYATTLRVQVKRDIDDKVLFDKNFHVAANTNGSAQASYRIVTDPIVLPLTRARLDMDYSIYVGLGGGAVVPAGHRHHARRSG